MTESESHSAELRAALRAREELGPQYEAAIVDSFVAKLDGAVDERVDAAVRNRLERQPGKRPVPVPIVSVIAGMLTTQVLANRLEADAVLAIILVWLAIAIINVLQYTYDRPRRL